MQKSWRQLPQSNHDSDSECSLAPADRQLAYFDHSLPMYSEHNDNFKEREDVGDNNFESAAINGDNTTDHSHSLSRISFSRFSPCPANLSSASTHSNAMSASTDTGLASSVLSAVPRNLTISSPFHVDIPATETAEKSVSSSFPSVWPCTSINRAENYIDTNYTDDCSTGGATLDSLVSAARCLAMESELEQIEHQFNHILRDYVQPSDLYTAWENIESSGDFKPPDEGSLGIGCPGQPNGDVAATCSPIYQTLIRLPKSLVFPNLFQPTDSGKRLKELCDNLSATITRTRKKLRIFQRIKSRQPVQSDSGSNKTANPRLHSPVSRGVRRSVFLNKLHAIWIKPDENDIGRVGTILPKTTPTIYTSPANCPLSMLSFVSSLTEDHRGPAASPRIDSTGLSNGSLVTLDGQTEKVDSINSDPDCIPNSSDFVVNPSCKAGQRNNSPLTTAYNLPSLPSGRRRMAPRTKSTISQRAKTKRSTPQCTETPACSSNVTSISSPITFTGGDRHYSLTATSLKSTNIPSRAPTNSVKRHRNGRGGGRGRRRNRSNNDRSNTATNVSTAPSFPRYSESRCRSIIDRFKDGWQSQLCADIIDFSAPESSPGTLPPLNISASSWTHSTEMNAQECCSDIRLNKNDPPLLVSTDLPFTSNTTTVATFSSIEDSTSGSFSPHVPPTHSSRSTVSPSRDLYDTSDGPPTPDMVEPTGLELSDLSNGTRVLVIQNMKHLRAGTLYLEPPTTVVNTSSGNNKNLIPSSHRACSKASQEPNDQMFHIYFDRKLKGSRTSQSRVSALMLPCPTVSSSSAANSSTSRFSSGKRLRRKHEVHLQGWQVTQQAVLEVLPSSVRHLPPGTRVCAPWSDQLATNLYPGTVVPVHREFQSNVEPGEQLEAACVPIDFDDGDHRQVHVGNVHILPNQFGNIQELGSCDELDGDVTSAIQPSSSTISDDLTSSGGRRKHRRHGCVAMTKRLEIVKSSRSVGHTEGSRCPATANSIAAQSTENVGYQPTEIQLSHGRTTSDSIGQHLHSSLDLTGQGMTADVRPYDSRSSSLWSTVSMPTSKEDLSAPRDTMSWHVLTKGRRRQGDRLFYRSIQREVDGLVVSIGDSVELRSSNEDEHFIGEVVEICWDAIKRTPIVATFWYYSPHEAGVDGQSIVDLKGALFATRHRDENEASCIDRVVKVHRSLKTFLDIADGCTEKRVSIQQPPVTNGSLHQPTDNESQGEEEISEYFVAGRYDPVEQRVVTWDRNIAQWIRRQQKQGTRMTASTPC